MKRKRWVRRAIICLLLIGLGVGSLIGIKLLFFYREVKAIDIENITLFVPTTIYDKNDKLITTIGLEQREPVSYEDISPHMIHAIISIEDQRFFEHRGIDARRIVAALIENVTTKSYKEGASTITQQLVKLHFLSNEKTLERKVKEALLSIRLEREYSKEKILELYLNKVLFGGRIYGVQNASRQYFGKTAKELTYEEAALLAGIVQSPNRYNPYRNPDETKSRQIEVLKQMYENGYITEEEYEQAKKRPLEDIILPLEEKVEDHLYHEYVDYVIQEIIQTYQLDPFQGGLAVYTYLDPVLQDHIMALEKNDALYKDDQVQTGIVLIENATGAIVGIGGGRHYNASLQFNYATDARLQPGSTIKPILDFGPAIEYLNYGTGTQIVDEKIYYSTPGDQFQAIRNYDRRYRGTLTLREALVDSRNTTAVKLFREVGSERAYAFAERLGLVFRDLKTEANAIGGFERGFTVLTMAGAYTAFANEGYYMKPTTIRMVKLQGEDITQERKKMRVMRHETAYLLTDMMHSNMTHGTAKLANLPNQYLAGKTGQTNFDTQTRLKYQLPSNAVRDSWFIGYSKAYTAAVCVGYNEMGIGHYLTPREARLSLELFRLLMEKAHEGLTTTPYQRPDTISEIEIELSTYPSKLPSLYTPQAFRRKELFIKGHEPIEISDAFFPRQIPQDIQMDYDVQTETLTIEWPKRLGDYTTNDFNLIAYTHNLTNTYDRLKANLSYEYQTKSGNYPSYQKDPSIMRQVNAYCRIHYDPKCQRLNQLTFQEHIQLLDAVSRYQRSLHLQKYDLIPLTEAEIADLKYRQQVLGPIVYTIALSDGQNTVQIYHGPYQKPVKVHIPMEQFLYYPTITISSDYSNVPGKLKSPPHTVLNPYYALY